MEIDKIAELGKIVEKYKNGKSYCNCLYLISQLEPDRFNYELLCQVFDDAVL